jgi:hypothetical protein
MQPVVGGDHLAPGRSHRWNVLPSTICAPNRSSS